MIETIEIQRMSYGPMSVGKLSSGKTCFVEGGIPNETCEVEVFREEERLAYGKKVQKNGQASFLPGQPWAHLPYEIQVEQKRQIIIEALVRVGGLDRETIVKNMPGLIFSPVQEYNYRNKIELAYRDGCLGMMQEGTSDFVKLDSYGLGCEAIEDAPKKIAGALRFATHGHDVGIFRVGVRASERTNSLEVAIWTTPGWFARAEVAKVLSSAIDATSIVRVIANEGRARRVKQVEVLAGDGNWHERLSNIDYRVSAPSFFQVNTWGAEQLQNIVIDFVKKRPGLNLKIADLYCGCGTFTLLLAKEGYQVTGVELAGSSTRDLKRNLKINRLKAEIFCDDVLKKLPDLNFMDVAIVDPPKSGLDKRVIMNLAAKTDCIIYVSCDPQTLARDVKRLSSFGFELQAVKAVDMFPQTYHVETVVLLSKKQR